MRTRTLTSVVSPLISFNIGYIYSFIAAGVFYYGFNHFFPHTESMLDHPITGEDIVVANDLKNLEQRGTKKKSLYDRIFGV